MYKWSQTSKNRLATVHPELQFLFNEVLKYRDCTVTDGHRGEKEQNEALARKTTTLAWPNSKHNKTPSIAIDVSPFPVNYDIPNNFIYFAGFVMGIAQKLYEEGLMKYRVRWGGDWNMNNDVKDQTFNDLPHFELLID